MCENQFSQDKSIAALNAAMFTFSVHFKSCALLANHFIPKLKEPNEPVQLDNLLYQCEEQYKKIKESFETITADFSNTTNLRS